MPDYHAGLAGILSALERDAEACDQYRAALAVSLRHEPDEAGAAVIVARYFLAEHLLKMKEPNQALAVIGPSVGLATKQEWLVRVVEARALWVLGRTGESRRAAELAVTRAPSETKANELRHHLAEILNSPKAG